MPGAPGRDARDDIRHELVVIVGAVFVLVAATEELGAGDPAQATMADRLVERVNPVELELRPEQRALAQAAEHADARKRVRQLPAVQRRIAKERVRRGERPAVEAERDA